jgi:hypothetical protein
MGEVVGLIAVRVPETVIERQAQARHDGRNHRQTDSLEEAATLSGLSKPFLTRYQEQKTERHQKGARTAGTLSTPISTHSSRICNTKRPSRP